MLPSWCDDPVCDVIAWEHWCGVVHFSAFRICLRWCCVAFLSCDSLAKFNTVMHLIYSGQGINLPDILWVPQISHACVWCVLCLYPVCSVNKFTETCLKDDSRRRPSLHKHLFFLLYFPLIVCRAREHLNLLWACDDKRQHYFLSAVGGYLGNAIV